MGNNPSTLAVPKKSKRESSIGAASGGSHLSVPEIPDNEHSTNTASSVNSILLHYQQQVPASAGSVFSTQPQQPSATNNENEKSDPNGECEAVDLVAPPPIEDQNQLTATSISSITYPNPERLSKNVNIDDLIQRLLEVGFSGRIPKSFVLKNSEIVAICQAAQEIFLSQPTLIELSPPVKIVGDVHGQYTDLMRLFEMSGFPPAANYLFLGDYVDRGKQSLETICLLLCYKIKWPENFFLLRGNHECANVTRVYGFYDECKRRCSVKIWKIFVDVFNTLPIAATVASKIFCVHGGLSPSLRSMDEIRSIPRPTDVPDYGLLNDLLWSDPSETAQGWEDNERGVSYCFGKVQVNDFLSRYGFDLVTRAHMVVEDGYEFFNNRTLVTVFSAPNYCNEFNNYGSVMFVNEDLLCSFELLAPVDQAATRREWRKRGRRPSPPMLSSTPQST
ncbi:uncharacterized protein VTP21DRAFT_1877 [Calcarisporiella thermophila]|uniref:uncharacterized protein n=1 Tax=Calcarisporiella thermophila TaxID=911321 RepID=UPI0037446278